jgi:hypothetical protein
MEENIMAKRSKGRNWWWLLLILALAGLGYYLYSQMGPDQKKKLIPEKVTPVQPERLMQKEPSTAKVEEKKPEISPVPTKEEPPLKPAPEEDYCTKIENEMEEFFHYLDQKPYVKYLDPNRDSYARFKDILKRCSARPPIPAGEGTDPKILIKNLYHFFRVLGRKDLKLISTVMDNEQDSMEYILAMLYRWITLDNRCPDPEDLRPSSSVRYQYAGFFLNTTGGRAYLFRRTQSLRLLANYYCVLIVHDADKKGENSYGIDVLAYISPLKKEIGLYAEFDFQREYLEKLNRIEDFYNKRR